MIGNVVAIFASFASQPIVDAPTQSLHLTGAGKDLLNTDEPSHFRATRRESETTGNIPDWKDTTPPPYDSKKPHVFVAMPYAEKFHDVYEFGIYEPVRRCGYICEKVDDASFTGDILQRIKDKIESAKLVIADLTESRPNVYLEVGYAWGHGVPVVFLAKEGEPLHFDVKTHKCIHYRTIGKLAKELEKLLRGIV